MKNRAGLFAIAVCGILAAGFLMFIAGATSATPTERPRTYVQLIVTACPAPEADLTNKPEAVTGYYADPVGQGVTYENQRGMTKQERAAYFQTLHCIDVPVPAEVILNGEGVPDEDGMTLGQCMGHRGFMTAMQFLEQNAAYKNSHPSVGAWQCHEQAFPPRGVAGM